MKTFSPLLCPPQHKQGAGKEAERKLEKNVATTKTSTDLYTFCPSYSLAFCQRWMLSSPTFGCEHGRRESSDFYFCFVGAFVTKAVFQKCFLLEGKLPYEFVF